MDFFIGAKKRLQSKMATPSLATLSMQNNEYLMLFGREGGTEGGREGGTEGETS